MFSYMDPKDPPDYEEIRKKIVPQNGEGVVGSIMAIIVMALAGGALLTIPLAFFIGGKGENASLSGPFFVGAIISGIAGSFLMIPSLALEQRVKEKYEAEARQIYEEQLRAYQAAKKAKEDAERRRREDEERWRREAPERERAEALRRQRQEEELRRLKIEQQREERMRAWQSAFDWARSVLETQYQRLAMQLAAEEGITNPAEVVRVFAVAYPHFDVAADWRMGCLRVIAQQDPRVAAILPHLPPPDSRNSKPI